MTYEAMHNAIRSKFQTDIVSGGHAATVVYDNEREAHPSDTTWVEANVMDTDTELVGTGARQTYRMRGELRATIRRPLQQGDAISLRLCDAIRSSFNRVIADGVHYSATSIGEFNRSEQYWETTAVTPFYQDDIVERGINVGSWSHKDREAAFNSIRSRFDGFFGSSGSVSTNTVVYDNAPTKPANDSRWISFNINTGVTEVVGVGANARARTHGIATAMICSPLGRGDRDSLALSDAIAQRFRSITDNGVVFEVPYVLGVGRRNQWFQTNVNIRFRLEEIVP